MEDPESTPSGSSYLRELTERVLEPKSRWCLIHKRETWDPVARLTPETANKVRMLGKVPLFSGLDEKELEAVAGACREVSFEPGKKILEQGEPGLSFLLVLEGEVEVRKKGRKVATLVPGGFFGEMTVFDEKPRSADIVATKQTKCLGIPSWSFIPLLKSNPSISIGIIRELVRRLREFDET